LHALHNRFLRTPNVSVLKLDPQHPQDYREAGGPFDTVLCVNVLEYVDDPNTVVRSAASVLKPGGSLVVLAPQGQALYGTLDKTLGHQRRFSRAQLRALLEQTGFNVSGMRQLNKIGAPGWWFYGKLLRRRQINKLTLKIFDKTVWIWRHLDAVLPWRGLSLIAVATKQAE